MMFPLSTSIQPGSPFQGVFGNLHPPPIGRGGCTLWRPMIGGWAYRSTAVPLFIRQLGVYYFVATSLVRDYILFWPLVSYSSFIFLERVHFQLACSVSFFNKLFSFVQLCYIGWAPSHFACSSFFLLSSRFFYLFIVIFYFYTSSLISLVCSGKHESSHHGVKTTIGRLL